MEVKRYKNDGGKYVCLGTRYTMYNDIKYRLSFSVSLWIEMKSLEFRSTMPFYLLFLILYRQMFRFKKRLLYLIRRMLA